MRCAWAALVAAACAAAQNDAVAALVAKYKKSAGGSPVAPTPAMASFQPSPFNGLGVFAPRNFEETARRQRRSSRDVE